MNRRYEFIYSLFIEIKNIKNERSFLFLSLWKVLTAVVTISSQHLVKVFVIHTTMNELFLGKNAVFVRVHLVKDS